MLVLHYTGMETAHAALQRLCDPDAKVSAHYVIEETGEVHALVPESKRAWHAGVSHWRELADINGASIGIEIVNGGHDFGLPDFPKVQVTALMALCQGILDRHPILPQNIVGHNEIAPDRKLDPGEKFPWAELARADIGLWPAPSDPGPVPARDLAQTLFARIGYAIDEVPLDGNDQHCLTSEFQRRYLPNRVDGKLDAETLARLQQIAALYCA
jgi:N-acetylmuramoyl-L-alanine amidase